MCAGPDSECCGPGPARYGSALQTVLRFVLQFYQYWYQSPNSPLNPIDLKSKRLSIDLEVYRFSVGIGFLSFTLSRREI
jgi:hypothetical protein